MEMFKAICTLIGTLVNGVLNCILSPVDTGTPPPTVLNVAVSVSECVAPCGVFVDLSGTTDPATSFPFHERYYSTDFGDPSAGNWSYGARNSVLSCGTGGQPTYCGFMPAASRNVGIGPEVGHVYATPGTYNIVASVTGPAGKVIAAPAVVEVIDPNVIYGGTWRGGVCDFTAPAIGCTACVGLADCDAPANYDPKGSGASFDRIVTDYLDAAHSNRVLLHAGEVFDAVNPVTVACHDCQIGSYGDGAQPIIQYRAPLNGSTAVTVGPRLTNVSIYDIQIDANGSPNVCSGIGQGSKRVLLYNFTCTRAGGFTGASTPIDNSARIDEIYVNSSSWHGVPSGNSNNCVPEVVYFRGVTRLSMLGLDLEMADSVSQSMTRLQNWQNIEIGHSYYGRPCTQRAMIDIRGDTGAQAGASAPVVIDRHANIHHIVAVGNSQSGGGGPAGTAIQPQGNPADDSVEDLIFESVACWLGATSSNGCFTTGSASNVTVRNYIVNGANRGDGDTVAGYVLAWDMVSRHPQPQNIWLYNSVFNCAGTIAGGSMVNVTKQYIPGTVSVKNSINYCQLAAGAVTVVDSNPSSSPVTAGNSDQLGGGPTADPMWSNASGGFSRWDDYAVGRPGYRNAGASVPVFFDIAGHPVPQTNPTIGVLQ